MNHETLTVYMLLTELKTMEKRVEKAIKTINPIGVKEAVAKNVDGIPEADFVTQAQSDVQRADDLIKRHHAMKSALYQYNSSKKINVAGREMTIAEALWLMEYGMQEKESLLEQYETAYQTAISEVRTFNDKTLSQMAERAAEIMYTTKDKANSQDYLGMVENYKKDHQKVLVDPLKLKDLIIKLSEEIALFKANVDAKIQMANATTEVTIEY